MGLVNYVLHTWAAAIFAIVQHMNTPLCDSVTTSKYFELKKLMGHRGTPELELLASNFLMYVQ